MRQAGGGVRRERGRARLVIGAPPAAERGRARTGSRRPWNGQPLLGTRSTPHRRHLSRRLLADDGRFEIAVADTGPGIPAGDLERVFQEFEQSSDGKKVEGTGLGLPLSRKLVELHGGRLWVESVVGRGSTFRFTLPVGPTEPSSVLTN